MHVAAGRGGARVDVGVRVHPDHARVGVRLQVAGKSAAIKIDEVQ